jgi:hypothetical protein
MVYDLMDFESLRFIIKEKRYCTIPFFNERVVACLKIIRNI